MNEYTFRVNLHEIHRLDCFKDATKDELKVLLTIISIGEKSASAETVAALTGISVARVKAAITLFSESGVLSTSESSFLAEVEYEFEKSKKDNTDSAGEVAKSIRENDLYELNIEMERILGKTLEVREVERITSLYTKKSLSTEYILTLAAFLKDKHQILSVERIVREANKLIAEDVDTLEDLEIYIEKKNEEIKGEMEMRRLFGIYGRTLTKGEREHFNRWLNEYGYSSAIIGEAYDISVGAINKLSFPYINSILTEWHTSGCTTLAECIARADVKKYEKNAKAKKSSQKTKKSVEAETPKYADFNSEDALMRALKRSYQDEADSKTEV